RLRTRGQPERSVEGAHSFGAPSPLRFDSLWAGGRHRAMSDADAALETFPTCEAFRIVGALEQKGARRIEGEEAREDQQYKEIHVGLTSGDPFLSRLQQHDRPVAEKKEDDDRPPDEDGCEPDKEDNEQPLAGDA